jgi:hypothetical protein
MQFVRQLKQQVGIPDVRSRSFTLKEIMHRTNDVTIEEVMVGLYRMGYMQAQRDIDGVPYKITSGRREAAYNKSIGSSDNSAHRWRIENGRLIGANDFVPIGKSLGEVYNRISKDSHGETYLHKKLEFIHNSDYNEGEVDEQWVQ